MHLLFYERKKDDCQSGRSNVRLERDKRHWPYVLQDGSTVRINKMARAASMGLCWSFTDILASGLVQVFKVSTSKFYLHLCLRLLGRSILETVVRLSFVQCGYLIEDISC